jgi:hypothetical protein
MPVLPGVAFGYRIAVEEAAMLSTLGEPLRPLYAAHLETNPYLV